MSVYLNLLNSGLPDSYRKGTDRGNKVIFKGGQPPVNGLLSNFKKCQVSKFKHLKSIVIIKIHYR